MASKEGVQQGDPLGPLLFSLVIQKLIAAIAAKCPGLALNLWYLDDGVLAGRTADVAAALRVIAEVGPYLGLELNLVKNEVVFFWDDTPDPFPAEVERFRGGFELLGSPIGDETFCSRFISKFTSKAVTNTLGPLSSLDDPQIVHMLIRLCASYCRVVHLLRAVPPMFAQAAIAEFDCAVQKALAHGPCGGALHGVGAAAAAAALGARRRGLEASCRALCWCLSGISHARGRSRQLAGPLSCWLQPSCGGALRALWYVRGSCL